MTDPRHLTNLGGQYSAEGRVAELMQEGVASMMNTATGGNPFLVRVVVEEVIFDPSVIDDKRQDFLNSKDNDQQVQSDAFLDQLPINSIVGRPVRSTTSGPGTSQYFFPFFPQHLMFPVKPGEHVWAFYEDPNKSNSYGYWLFKISEPRSIDDLNYTHSDRKHDLSNVKGTKEKADGGVSDDGKVKFNNGPVTKVDDEETHSPTGATYPGGEDAYEKLIQASDASKVTDYEDVPRFKKRPGDLAIQGSNNTLIVLGTDRTGQTTETDSGDNGKTAKGRPDKDKTGKAGTIDIVAGRGQGDKTKPGKTVDNPIGKEISKAITDENDKEGDPDFENDLARIYLSMKTDPDKNFNVKVKGVDQTDGSDGVAAAIIKVDHVRIIARKTVKFLVQPSFDSPEDDCGSIVINEKGDIIHIPSTKGVVKLGSASASKALLCQPVGVAGGDSGSVTAPPIIDTMGAQVGTAGQNGEFSKKVLIE